MAKTEKPAQQIVLSDEQKMVAKPFESDVEKYTTYQSAAGVANRLKNSKEKLSKEELNTLLKFYNNNNFSTEEKESLELNEVQQINLVTNIKKLKSPELGVNFATQNFMIGSQNPELTKIIEKDADASTEYATEYYKQNVGAEDVRWCFDLVISNIKKDLVSKKPKAESFSQIAKFIYETQPVAMYEGDTELRTELYNPVIEGYFADRIFGSDEQIARIPNQKKKAALISKKENFMNKVRDAIVEEHDATKLAEAEAEEAKDTKELESDKKMDVYIQNLTNQKFSEKYAKEIKTTEIYMNDIKKRHPKDYEEYLAKLRKSRAYKKAYKKYSEMYTNAREALKTEVVTKIKDEIKNTSKQQVLHQDDENEVMVPEQEEYDEQIEKPAEEQAAEDVVEEKPAEEKVENKPEEKIEQKPEEKPEEKAEAKPEEKNEEEPKEQEENSKEPEVLEAEVITPEQQKEMEKENAKEESKESPKVEEKTETKDEEKAETKDEEEGLCM